MRKVLRPVILLTLCLAIAVTVSQPVFAVTNEDIKAINRGTPFYDPNYTYNDCSISTSVSASASGSINLQGNDNAEKTWNFFISKGFSAEQVAGIIGNLAWESGINPTRLQSRGNTQDPSNVKIGWGLMQWTPGSKIINIAKQAGVTTPIYELGTQLEIVWWHLNNSSPTGFKSTITGLKQKTTIEDSVTYFEEKMEAAGKPVISERIRLARQNYNRFSGKIAPPPVIADPNITQASAAAVGCPVGTGDAQSLDGFVLYSQYDPAWASKAYSSSTIQASGCGPTAMAMIISTLTGQQVTPDITAQFAAEQNLFDPRDGSSWNIAPVLAGHWGLKADKISKNITDISTALSEGKFVILSGSGQLPFTSDGHYITIRGIDANGNLLIGDPGHNGTSTKAWNAQELLANANEGSAYAISK